jgi:hypothetical protein
MIFMTRQIGGAITERMRILDTGYVGIGTAPVTGNPQQPFHVCGPWSNPVNSGSVQSSIVTIEASIGGNCLFMGITPNSPGPIAAWIQSGNANPALNAWYPILLNPLGGPVGVYTMNPVLPFAAYGSTYGRPANSGVGADGTLRVGTAGHGECVDVGILGGGAWLQARSTVDYGTHYNLLLNPNGGNVAIGANNAQAQLYVYGTGQANRALDTTVPLIGGALTLQDSGGGLNNGGALIFGANQGNFAAIKGAIQNGGVNTTGLLSFQLRSIATDACLTEIMTLDPAGICLYSIPAGNPGAGTKRLWYDPVTNHVMYAP